MIPSRRIAWAIMMVLTSLSVSGCSSYSSHALLPHAATTGGAERNVQKLDPGHSRHKHFAGLLPGIKPHAHDPRKIIQHGAAHEVEPPTGPRVEAAFKRLRGGSRSGTADGSRQVRNVATGYDTAGQFGIYEYPNQTFRAGSFGFQTGYELVEMAFMFNGNNILYAPTNRAPGGNCLEIGSGYWGVQAKVYAYDFCDGTGKFHWLEDINDSFRQNFERDWGDGLPSYFYETYWNESINGYTVLLYNATVGQWVWEYNSTGSTVGLPGFATNGWNMFETHYLNGGACPPVLSAHGADAQWLNPATNAWEFLDSVPGLVNNYHWNEAGTDCLNQDDGSGRGYWYALSISSGHDWYVDSYPSASYTGGGGGCDPTVSDCCAIDGTCTCDLYSMQGCCGMYDAYSCGDCGDIIYYTQNPVDCYAKGSSIRRSVNIKRRQQSAIGPPERTDIGTGNARDPKTLGPAP